MLLPSREETREAKDYATLWRTSTAGTANLIKQPLAGTPRAAVYLRQKFSPMPPCWIIWSMSHPFCKLQTLTFALGNIKWVVNDLKLYIMDVTDRPYTLEWVKRSILITDLKYILTATYFECFINTAFTRNRFDNICPIIVRRLCLGYFNSSVDFIFQSEFSL